MIAKELMLTNRSMPRAVVIPELAYPDVSEAVKWLCHVFGFRQRLIIGNHRVQLLVGKDGAVVVVQSSAGDVQDARHSIMVRVPEVGEHHATSKHRGARILKPLADYPYGERQYTAQDLGGHIWTFSQSISDVDPAQWGGKLLADESRTMSSEMKPKKTNRGRIAPSAKADKPKTHDDYLVAVSDDKRAALEKLRKSIKAAAPEAEECISYQLPAFRLNGKLLVAYGAAANHCAFYPGSTLQAIKNELKDYDTSKGTIRFPPKSPLPPALVRKLVKLRIAEKGG
jgi:uncharacterized protein YdhG (YjbR/CyaY superfamily)/uncharacterized glyoxalase superfamily protein PhnB